jgi:hypothetical protein
MLMNVIVGIWREFGNEEGRKKEETVSADCDISCPSHTVIFTRLFPFFSFSLQYNQRVLIISFYYATVFIRIFIIDCKNILSLVKGILIKPSLYCTSRKILSPYINLFSQLNQ